MEFDKIKAEVKKVGLDLTRIDNDNYFEAVVKRICLKDAVCLLERIFGLPAWPSSNKLSNCAKKVIKDFGGLRSGQTLYLLNEEGLSIFAMLWPWQDGERITVKIARIKDIS